VVLPFDGYGNAAHVVTATSPKAFALSITLHAAIAAALLVLARGCSQQIETVKIIELVAGEGDNFGATEAPALGVEGGVKIDLPEAPTPQPPAPQPSAPEPVVVAAPEPAPPPKATPTPKQPASEPPPSFVKNLKAQVRAATAKAKREIAAAEKKRLADEKKRLDAEKKQADAQKKTISKEEFDRMNKSKASSPAPKAGTTRVAKIDTEGIRKGVVGGSTANKIGGAGGKALKSENDDLLAAYYSMFKQRLRTAFEGPPGLSDSLKVTVEAQSHADGRVTGARVVQGSGSAEFDAAVLDAVRRVQMPARPDKKSEQIEFVFTMRERNEG
jgi:colicin import membrane protein